MEVGVNKRLEQYRKAVIDFLNADNLNDAMFGLLPNIEKAFGFDDGWAEEVSQYGFCCDLKYRPVHNDELPPEDYPVRWYPREDLFNWSIKREWDDSTHAVILTAIMEWFKPAVDFFTLSNTEDSENNYASEYLLWVYNEVCYPKLFLYYHRKNKNEWEVVEKTPFNMYSFITRKLIHEAYPKTSLIKKNPSIWENAIRTDTLIYSLVFCFIQFLKADRNNRYRIKKCPYCNQYYYAKNINRNKRCYKLECERLYNAERQWRLRDKDPKKHGTTSGQKKDYRSKVSHEN